MGLGLPRAPPIQWRHAHASLGRVTPGRELLRDAFEPSEQGPEPKATPAARPEFTLTFSRDFLPWLADGALSLAFTTYQTGKIFLLGTKEDGSLSVFERSFARCMGLWAEPQRLWMSSLFQLWRFENILAPGATDDGYDRLYVPTMSYTTADVDVHDVAVDGTGEPLFVCTLFNCLARPSPTHSFVPVWKPPFVTGIVAEDRCHLNGLALRDGRAAYVTAVAASDVADGWRERRRDGGVVVDVATGEVVAGGLSMPHSPRWYQDRLWVLNSGTGEFGWVDPRAGRFVPVAFCPGYLRGLAFTGPYAIVGSSRAREDRTFQGLPLDEALVREKVEPRCGLFVIDLRSGEKVHWVRLEGAVRELYDVCALPGVRRPRALGLRTDEIRRTVTVGPFGALARP